MAREVLQPILEEGGIAARAPQLLAAIRQVTLAENADQRAKALDALAPPALDVLLDQLEAHVKMSWPRCGVTLPRPEMAKHLWNDHKLMLDGRRVREPWSAIDGWIVEHAASGADDLLERGVALGQQLDP